MAAPPSPSCLPHEMDTPEEWRDWAELPRDVLLAVLSRLDHIEILMGPDMVCSQWRRATMDEPELWRRVDMRFHYADRFHLNYRKLLLMVRAAMRRSAGRCEAFWGGSYIAERILSIVADAAPSLKSLRIIENRDIVDTAFKPVITKFPMLEELELSNCMHKFPSTLEIIGDACPLLRHFRLSQSSFYSECVDDSPAMAVAMMPELRSLQLNGISITNSGLEVILNCCPHLESLDIRHCFHVCMDDDMRAKCSKIKTLRHPTDSMKDYDLSYNYMIPRPCWSTQSYELSDGCRSPY